MKNSSKKTREDSSEKVKQQVLEALQRSGEIRKEVRSKHCNSCYTCSPECKNFK